MDGFGILFFNLEKQNNLLNLFISTIWDLLRNVHKQFWNRKISFTGNILVHDE